MVCRLVIACLLMAAAAPAAERPNILWILFEDINPVTPHVDRFA